MDNLKISLQTAQNSHQGLYSHTSSIYRRLRICRDGQDDDEKEEGEEEEEVELIMIVIISSKRHVNSNYSNNRSYIVI